MEVVDSAASLEFLIVGVLIIVEVLKRLFWQTLKTLRTSVKLSPAWLVFREVAVGGTLLSLALTSDGQ